MQQLIKNLLERNAFKIATALTVAIFYLSIVKSKNLPQIKFTYADKFEHSFAYGSTCLFWLIYIHYKTISKPIWVILLLTLYGAFIEIIQHNMSNGRTGDWYDVLANFTGCVLGWICFLNLRKLIA